MQESIVWQKLRVCYSVSTTMPAKTPLWNTDIKLSRSDKMFWACPVFDDYDRAVEYMNWNKDAVREVTILSSPKSER